MQLVLLYYSISEWFKNVLTRLDLTNKIVYYNIISAVQHDKWCFLADWFIKQPSTTHHAVLYQTHKCFVVVMAESMIWKPYCVHPCIYPHWDVAVGCRSVCMISMHSFRFPTTTTSASVLNVGLLLLLWGETFATLNLSDTVCGLQQAVEAGCRGWLSAAGNWTVTYIL